MNDRIHVAWLVWLLACLPFRASAVTLFEHGRATASIVIDRKACPSVRMAADELRRYVKKAGGVEIAIVDDAAQVSGARILVGASRATERLGLNGDKLKPEGYLIRTVGDALVILGRDDTSTDPMQWRHPHMFRTKGTLFGVYEFLERHLGVRWYFPGEMGEIVHRVDTLTVDALDIVDYPRFECRTMWPVLALDMEEMRVSAADMQLWRLRNRYGGSYLFPCNHSFGDWAQRFGKSHPEYFALKKDGSRDNDPGDKYHGHLCYSEPGVLRQCVQDAKDWFGGNATRGSGTSADGFFAVMPNDAYTGCECERCKARFSKETENSERVWGFVARVAREVAKEFPNARISNMSYNGYREFPQTVTMPDNVHVRVAAGSRRLTGEPMVNNANLETWSQATQGKVHLWVYWNTRDGKPLGLCGHSPHNAWTELRSYVGKVRTVFIEFSNWSTHQAERYRGKKVGYSGKNDSWMFDHLNTYVAFKALWNPDFDLDGLLDEYHENMFGKAAPIMKRFYDELERTYVEKVDIKRLNDYALWEEVYTEDRMDKWAGYFKQALATAEARDRERVAFIREWLYGELETRRNEYETRKGDIDARKLACRYVRSFGEVDADARKEVWRRAEAGAEFRHIKTGQAAGVRTRVKTAWDDDHLYVLCECGEPKMAELNTKFESPDLWKNDGVELFLAPGADYLDYNYYQVIIDAAGKLQDIRWTDGNRSDEWGCGATVATRQHADSYVIEAKIPFAALGQAKPEDDVIWRVNVGRNRILASAEDTEVSTWSLLTGGFHKPDRFGRLCFEKPPDVDVVTFDLE
ncbi:MAG: DUF4838 domain-containing protein [Kiritimatiellae bacterium]|nr:DUF4838 domain-containing protein [Kiritimatiellia bacterium]